MGVVFCYFVAETEQNCIAFEELATKKKEKQSITKKKMYVRIS